jgi:hypothetical protein
MAKLKLSYFDFHGGRGEPARLALSMGGIPFDVQAPSGLNRALDELAARQRTTRSELVRRVLIREAEAAGVKLDERMPA